MKAIWDGAINFGLVNIPVRMYSGSSKHEGLSFDMLRKGDHSPIKYQRVAAKDGQEVDYADIVKGYEISKGNYVIITPKDFEDANAHKSRNITIKQFVAAEEIDSRYYETPYYLEPGEHAADTYALLREALEKNGKIALALYVLHGHESIAAIRPVGKLLVLNQMRFPADLRDPHDLSIPEGKPDSSELKLASELIAKLTKPFIAEDWHDTYTEELQDLIKAKSKGKVVADKSKKAGHAHPTGAKDIAKALKESLK